MFNGGTTDFINWYSINIFYRIINVDLVSFDSYLEKNIVV